MIDRNVVNAMIRDLDLRPPLNKAHIVIKDLSVREEPVTRKGVEMNRPLENKDPIFVERVIKHWGFLIVIDCGEPAKNV